MTTVGVERCSLCLSFSSSRLRRLRNLPSPKTSFSFLPAPSRWGALPTNPAAKAARPSARSRSRAASGSADTRSPRPSGTLLAGANPAYFTACGERCPIENIDFYAMLAYANAMSAAAGLPLCYELTPAKCDEAWGGGATSCTGATFAGLECRGYRLPTAAEWEYAYRAGTATAYYNGPVSSGSTAVSIPTSTRSPGTAATRASPTPDASTARREADRAATPRIRSAPRHPTRGVCTIWPATCGRTCGIGTRATPRVASIPSDPTSVRTA